MNAVGLFDLLSDYKIKKHIYHEHNLKHQIHRSNLFGHLLAVLDDLIEIVVAAGDVAEDDEVFPDLILEVESINYYPRTHELLQAFKVNFNLAF